MAQQFENLVELRGDIIEFGRERTDRWLKDIDARPGRVESRIYKRNVCPKCGHSSLNRRHGVIDSAQELEYPPPPLGLLSMCFFYLCEPFFDCPDACFHVHCSTLPCERPAAHGRDRLGIGHDGGIVRQYDISTAASFQAGILLDR